MVLARRWLYLSDNEPTKPSEPNENRAKEYQSRIVRFAVSLLTLVLPLSQHERVCESRDSGCDVDRSTSGVLLKSVSHGQYG